MEASQKSSLCRLLTSVKVKKVKQDHSLTMVLLLGIFSLKTSGRRNAKHQCKTSSVGLRIHCCNRILIIKVRAENYVSVRAVPINPTHYECHFTHIDCVYNVNES